MIQISIPFPDDLHPQTAADREDMAGPMGAWVRNSTDAVIAEVARQHPDREVQAVEFRGASSSYVRDMEHRPPANATPFEAVMLKRRRLVWKATYLVDLVPVIRHMEPADEGEAVRRGGRLD